MNEYGKRVAKKTSEYMDNPDSIDKEVSDIQGAIEGVEVRGALAAGVKKSFDKSKDAEERSVEQTDRVDKLIRENPQPSEVVDARGNHQLLGDRLNSVDSQLAQTNQQVSNLENTKAGKNEVNQLASNKADIIYVDNKIESLDGLQLKGAFNTLAELRSAYPEGSPGLYMVYANNHWYFWGGDDWEKGNELVMPDFNEYMYEDGEVLV